MVVVIRRSRYRVLSWALVLQRDKTSSARGKVFLNGEDDKIFIDSESGYDGRTEE